MAVGRNASAGLGSIAIGANASAGLNLSLVLSEIREIVEASEDKSLKLTFNELTLELNQPHKNPAKIWRLWETLKASAALNGAIGLVSKATDLIRLVAG